MHVYCVIVFNFIFVQIRRIPGVMIFRFIAPLCFTNVSVFKSRLAKTSGVNPAQCDHTPHPKGCLEQAVDQVRSQIGDMLS